jgi:serine/threonine protein phosphatase PrpC
MTDALSATKSIALRSAQITNVGGRQSNQDALGSALQEDLACYVVSDGAGGHEGGEIAANIVVKAVLDSFLRDLSFSNCAIRSYVDNAIFQVARTQAEQHGLKDMSATVATILIDQKNRVALWAHMGDTRIYLFRCNKLHAMTKDHSVVQRFIDSGYCEPDQVRTHPLRSVLFAAIGAEGDPVPEITEEVVEIQDGDAFLICSDGFWEWVTEDDMEQTLARSTRVDDWLAAMSSIAEKNGSDALTSRDNYTALTIWLGEPQNKTIHQ